MTKPRNFPERKRQRQIVALANLKREPFNAVQITALQTAIAAGNQRDKRTKIDRTARGRFART